MQAARLRMGLNEFPGNYPQRAVRWAVIFFIGLAAPGSAHDVVGFFERRRTQSRRQEPDAVDRPSVGGHHQQGRTDFARGLAKLPQARPAAIDLVQRGAHSYCRKPPALRELKVILRRAYEYVAMKRELERRKGSSVTGPDATEATLRRPHWIQRGDAGHV